MDASCMLLTGLLILCDWVASSEPFEQDRIIYAGYPERSRAIAERTLREYGLISERLFPQIGSFDTMWPGINTPRPLQRSCESLGQDAMLTVIEAPMGEGKTEAALYFAGRLCARLEKRGIYVALPTQATSNQMHGRVDDMLSLMEDGHARLMHGTAFLKYDNNIRSEDEYEAEKWLRPLRMGLLGEHAVGTVDQAMAAVLTARFSMLRLLGLSEKVLIIDELHAYDAYMGEIIKSLLCWCKALQIPVILLSATLQEKQRRDYIGCYTDDLYEMSTAYPLITQVNLQGEIRETVIDAAVASSYCFIPHPIGNDAQLIADFAVGKVQNGGCCCVLLNTVRKAQEVYKYILDKASDDTDKMLFHARFIMGKRDSIEKKCLSLYGKGDDSQRPKKAILVATQVVEQSLDIDFDCMISELAPIDLLLQRAGRVHRHRDRVRPKGMEKPCIDVIMPAAGDTSDPERRFGPSSYVYAPFLLMNTQLLLKEGMTVNVPSDVRKVIGAVYDKVTPENMTMWAKMSFSQQLMQANARGIAYQSPHERIFFPAESHDEFENIDVDDGYEPSMRVATRLGESTIRLSFCGPSLAEKVKTENISGEEIKEVFLASAAVHLSGLTLKDMEESSLYQIRKGPLRGCLISDDFGLVRLGKYNITNDPIFGIRWEVSER